MYCISISHKCTPVEIREQFAMDRERRQQFISMVKKNPCFQGVVALSTCNRCEIYFTASPKEKREQESVKETMEELFTGFFHISLEMVKKYILHYEGEGALAHLFKVVCGFDSMVLGEDEILGQVKDAYEQARKAGSTDKEINLVFQAGISCAKEIKTDTMLSKASVSVGTLAAKAVSEFPGEHKNVLIMGMSGKMGSIVMKNLLGRPDVSIRGTSRNHNKLKSQLVGYEGVQAVNYQERYTFINEADVVVSATTSPHYTITYRELKDNLTIKKPRLFLDLAVPVDIDRKIAEIEDVTLWDIDYFSVLSARNDAIREKAFGKAEEIMEHRLEEVKKELVFHDFYPVMEETVKRISQYEPHKLLYTLRDVCDSGELKVILHALKRV